MSDLPRLDADGPLAPPRSNGELVFAAPWQSRAFGLAVTLHRQGHFSWEEFRTRLIAEIGSWEEADPSVAGFSYYGCWLAALEKLLAEKGICSARALERRQQQLDERPHGHDH